MKSSNGFFIFFFFFFSALLIFSFSSYSASAARLLPQQELEPVEVEVDLNGTVDLPASSETEVKNFKNVMGAEVEEECNEKEEECVKRRMVAEAHLDYIYTQHHNP